MLSQNHKFCEVLNLLSETKADGGILVNVFFPSFFPSPEAPAVMRFESFALDLIWAETTFKNHYYLMSMKISVFPVLFQLCCCSPQG